MHSLPSVQELGFWDGLCVLFFPVQQLNFRLTDLRTTGDWLWLFFCWYEPGCPAEVHGDAVLEKYLHSFSQLCVFIAQTSEHVSPLSDYLCFQSRFQSFKLLSSLELSDCTGWLVVFCPIHWAALAWLCCPDEIRGGNVENLSQGLWWPFQCMHFSWTFESTTLARILYL